MVRIHLGQPILGDPDLVGVAARRGRSSIGRAPALQAGSCGFKSRRLHHYGYVNFGPAGTERSAALAAIAGGEPHTTRRVRAKALTLIRRRAL